LSNQHLLIINSNQLLVCTLQVPEYTVQYLGKGAGL
jgi:hypothetical protein